jgi:hypothetical protein
MITPGNIKDRFTLVTLYIFSIEDYIELFFHFNRIFFSVIQ